MKIKIKNNNEATISEESSMGGGSVSGMAGNINKEDEVLIREEHQEIAEISQSSAIQGRNSFPTANEHPGRVKRAKHQGLKNVIEIEKAKGKKKMRIKIKRKVNEHFYTTDNFPMDAKDDPRVASKNVDPNKAITNEMVEFIANNLSTEIGSIKIGDIQAAGAEGIVTSISDTHVVKLFFGIENAMKNFPLIGKDVSYTPNVVDGGKVIISDAVKLMYYKKYSTHPPEGPINQLFFIVMERIKPSPQVYRSIEQPWKNFNLLNTTVLMDNSGKADLMGMYEVVGETHKKRINEIYLNFVAETQFEHVVGHTSIEQFAALSRKQKNQTNQQFSGWRKKKKGIRVLINEKGGPILLKNIILSIAAGWNNVENAQEIIEYLKGTKDFRKPIRKVPELPGKKLGEVLLGVIDVVKSIWDDGMPFIDVHQEQFGFKTVNGQPVLAAMDLGAVEKDFSKTRDADVFFNSRVLHYSPTLKRGAKEIGYQSALSKAMSGLAWSMKDKMFRKKAAKKVNESRRKIGIKIK